MKFSLVATVPTISLLTTTIYAQTFTSCNPMNQTDCPLDTALGVKNYTIDFTSSTMSSRVWNATAGSVTYGNDGAQFTINQRGDAPTVQTNFYIFFGQVEVWMKAAVGQGVVSSIVLESDDLDEVDWEWIGGNDSYVQTNYFGKGNTTSYDRAAWYPVADPQNQWHNYTVDWSAEKLDWYIDGQIIRTLKYADANGGHNFPQTPCNVRLGIWAGGDPKNPNGTIEWAGGEVDYNNVPFTMSVKSVRISDASTGTQYKYGDETGSFESIKVLNNTAALKLDGANSGSTSQTLVQKWHGLSSTTKAIIIGSVGGVAAVCVGVFAFCCIKQRRLGKHERLAEDARFERETSELLAYRAETARLRSEQLAEMHAMQMNGGRGGGGGGVVQGVAGNGNAMGGYYAPSRSPLMGPARGNSPNPGYANGNYAQSVSTSGSGRGYQRY